MSKAKKSPSRPTAGRVLIEKTAVKLSDEAVQDDKQSLIIINRSPIGSSGIRNFHGYISEDYLQTLFGHLAADVFDKMRRSESQIAMILAAVKNPIKAAQWSVEAADDTPEQDLMAEFCEHVLFRDMEKSWTQFLQEALSVIDFGHSVFEVTHKVVLDHPKYGSYNGIRQLGWRSPRTLYRFNVDRETGQLESVTQISVGDLQRYVDIPAQFLLVFSLNKEGDNYEGISMLRPCYGAYLRKQTYLKLQAIGIEKFAVPTVIGTIPEGQQESPAAANFKEALEVFTSAETNYITLPSGEWKVELHGNDYDPNKVMPAIESEDRNMVKAFLANFLELGMSSGGGSWALSFDQSDFFLTGIEHVAQIIAEGINSRIIPDLIKMKWGPQDRYPTLKFTGISDEAGKELAESLKFLAEAQVIVPDDELEDDVRKRYKLPKSSDKGKRNVIAKGSDAAGAPVDPTPPTGQGAAGNASGTTPSTGENLQAAERAWRDRIALAEKIGKKQIADGKEILLPIMQEGLKGIADGMVAQIRSNLKSSTPASRIDANKGVAAVGTQGYKKALVQALVDVSAVALGQARKEVPKKAGIKLAGEPEGITLAAKPRYRIEDLPTGLQKRIASRVQALVDSQVADISKIVNFAFIGSVDTTDDDDVLEKDIDSAIDKAIEGSSVDAAAGNSAAYAVNDARAAFFFDDEVLQDVESFTFTNGDPVSEICQDLAGTTFNADDPEAQRYFPPLHHNCKSYLVPNLVGTKGNPKIDPNGLVPSSPDLNKYITLSEAHKHGNE